MTARSGINRRTFLHTMAARTGAGFLGAAIVARRASGLENEDAKNLAPRAAAEAPRVPVVDTHLHCFAGQHPGQLTAARIHAYNPERLPPYGKPELAAFWQTAADLGLAIQLHFEPRYAPGFEPLIREFAKTLVLIDHLGRPLQGTEAEYETIVKWSQLQNTVMKLSALPEKREYPHRDIAPFVKRLTDAWGPQRLLYGGGYSESATAESYRACRERLREYLAHLSAADQADILGGNAVRLFNWPM